MKLRRLKASFDLAKNKDVNRSAIITMFNHKSTFNAAKLVPLHFKAVLPGDIIKGNTAAAVRSTTPLAPVMDNMYWETWSFFVANRNLMDGWEELQGQNTKGKWKVGSQGTKGKVPVINPPVAGWDIDSIAEKFGLPINVNHNAVSHLPIRGYVSIWDTFFRDQNNQVSPFFDYKNNTATNGVTAGAGDPIANAWKGGEMLPVNKFYDYFTYALPGIQKADDVLIPLGSFAPVSVGPGNQALLGSLTADMEIISTSGDLAFGAARIASMDGDASFVQGALRDGGNNRATNIRDITDIRYIDKVENLQADLSKASGISITDLRNLIATQHIFEGDALHGTRYFERLESIWGVFDTNGRLDRPEFLGHTKAMLNMEQVVQTSSTDNVTPQGNTAAYSLTGHVEKDYFNYAVKEHGYIITVGAIRQDHTYSYGIHKEWNKLERFDFFEPPLATISYQPILNQEIYAQGNVDDKLFFGYRPAWDEYRHEVNIVSGDFRPAAAAALKQWTYADEFSNLPILGDDFVKETPAYIDRTLAINSTKAPQFKMDWQITYDSDRPVPMNSIPGLERI